MGGRIIEEELPGEPTYFITLDHLSLRDRVRLLKGRGVSREDRRRMIESYDERSNLFSLTHEEGFRYQQIEDRRKMEADELNWSFYRGFCKFSSISGGVGGIGAAMNTGELKWIPIGIATGLVLGVGVPVVMGIANYFGEVMDDG